MMLCPTAAAVSWARVVSVADGTAWNLRIRTAMPISIRPRMMPSIISVCWARRARGCLNSGTAFAIASTPVSAEQPEANALSSSRMPTVSVACGRWPAGGRRDASGAGRRR